VSAVRSSTSIHPGGKLEARDIDWKNGAELERRGVVTAVHTDDPINDSRWMLRSAALSVRGGMSREKAIESVTLAGAKMLGLDARVGSLEPGKDADFVLLSGDPLVDLHPRPRDLGRGLTSL
jgi:imidazolonepropionase-like amidohydrolase